MNELLFSTEVLFIVNIKLYPLNYTIAILYLHRDFSNAIVYDCMCTQL